MDWHRIRSDFPILAQQVNGHPLVYLDSAATSQSRLARNQMSGNIAANQENPSRTITVRAGLPAMAGR